MSEEREKRKAKQDQQEPKSGVLRKIVVAVLIVAAFAGAYYLGRRKRTSRLDAFAKCLAGKQVRMYGAYWCPHCADQKDMFGTSFQYIPYVECGVRGSHEEAPSCVQVGVKHFPTWQFGDGERREGTLPLPVLGAKTGCNLP